MKKGRQEVRSCTPRAWLRQACKVAAASLWSTAVLGCDALLREPFDDWVNEPDIDAGYRASDWSDGGLIQRVETNEDCSGEPLARFEFDLQDDGFPLMRNGGFDPEVGSPNLGSLRLDADLRSPSLATVDVPLPAPPQRVRCLSFRLRLAVGDDDDPFSSSDRLISLEDEIDTSVTVQTSLLNCPLFHAAFDLTLDTRHWNLYTIGVRKTNPECGLNDSTIDRLTIQIDAFHDRATGPYAFTVAHIDSITLW